MVIAIPISIMAKVESFLTAKKDSNANINCRYCSSVLMNGDTDLRLLVPFFWYLDH